MSLMPLWVSSMKNLNALGDSALLKKIVVVCKWQRSSYLVLVFLPRRERKKLPIILDEIHPHWRRLSVIGQEVDAHFSVTEE